MDELERYAHILFKSFAHNRLIYLAYFKFRHCLSWLAYQCAIAVLLGGLLWLGGYGIRVNNLVVRNLLSENFIRDCAK